MFTFGQEQTIEVNGQKYRLDKMRRKYNREWFEWVAKQVGDPFAMADKYLGKVSEAQWAKMFAQAQETAAQLTNANPIGDLGSKFLIGNEEGLCRYVKLLMSKHHPEATADEVEAVADVVADNIMKILMKAGGQGPNEAAPETGRGEQPLSTGTKCTPGSGTGPAA